MHVLHATINCCTNWGENKRKLVALVWACAKTSLILLLKDLPYHNVVDVLKNNMVGLNKHELIQ